MKKAVLFDLDGVIVHTAQYHYDAWKRLADSEGIYFDQEINERLKGVSRARSLEIILERSKRTYTEEEKKQICDRKNLWYTELIATLTKQDILPGVEEFLTWLRTNRIQTALCSASMSAEKIIRSIGLTAYFDCMVDAGKLRRQKPDPEIFLSAAQELDMPYENCIVVEDSQAGLKAAESVHMHTIGIGQKERLNMAEIVVENMESENLDIIKKWMMSL